MNHLLLDFDHTLLRALRRAKGDKILLAPEQVRERGNGFLFKSAVRPELCYERLMQLLELGRALAWQDARGGKSRVLKSIAPSVVVHAHQSAPTTD